MTENERLTENERRRRMEGLFEEHREAVMAYATRRAPALAHDVTSETFLLVWRRLEDVPDEPRAWLLGVARKALANQLRGERRRAMLVRRATTVWEPVSERADELGLDDELMLAFDALAAADREAIALIAWEGCSYDEAAQVMGCSRGAFAVRLHRARRQLAGALGESRRTVPLAPVANGTGT